jgi:hypothetical protein
MGDILILQNLAGVFEYVGSHSQKISLKKFYVKFFTQIT